MKILYFDCFSGISGDMTVGALVDLGVDSKLIETELAKLGLEAEYRLNWEKVVKKGISSTKFDVHLVKKPNKLKEHDHAHSHEHSHEHSDHAQSHEHSDHAHGHRHYQEIVGMIRSSDLSDRVKEISLNIFERIGRAEGKIHNLAIENVHFHEVGAIDSIIDIVATAIAIESIQPDRILSSPLPVGGGQIKIDHGIYPVPAPATLEILRGVPLESSHLKSELVTPTGAGIIKTLVDDYGPIPSVTVKDIGYGAGTKDFPDRPNVLRLLLGEI